MTGALLIMGAAGQVGGALVAALRAAGAEVRAAVRDPARAGLPDGVDVVAADFDRPASVAAAATGARGAFVIGGRNDMPGLLATLASAGVEHVVLLTSRSVLGRVPGNAVADMWASSEAALHASGLAWTILRPSGFSSNALRWLPQLAASDTVRGLFGDAAIAAIDPDDIAAVAAAALTGRRHDAHHLELSGPAPLTPAAQVEILGRALGRPLRFEPLAGAAADAELASLFPPPVADAMRRFFDAGEFDDARVVSTVADVLGRPARSFEQWAAAHASAFRAEAR